MKEEVKSSYISTTQQQLLQLVEVLSRRMLQPTTITELVMATGQTRDKVFRTLRNLEEAGWAERMGEGWILSPTLTRMAERLRTALAAVGQRYLNQND